MGNSYDNINIVMCCVLTNTNKQKTSIRNFHDSLKPEMRQ